ncbi:MAG: hypothetical protein JWP95_325 [Actinotalea sp.]|nr:hypothetical protein [Actinotalea sp.]
MTTSDDAPVAGGPLAGLRVIELGQYISGPFAGKLLGDMGAHVTKVEAPEGDPMRRWDGSGTYSPQFAAYNRNKSGLVLDLKTSGGLAELLALATDSDVLIENFRPGVAERLGFGPAALASVNPRIVTCSITGFGSTGPYADRPAYDTVISAVAGMYHQIAPADALRPVGPAFSDLLSGISAVQGVLSALYARERTGVGEHVAVSMVGSLMDFLTESVSTYLLTGEVSGPDSRARRAQAYACVGSDGLGFVIHMSVPQKFWAGLVRVLERPDLLEDPRFARREGRVSHYEALDRILKAETRRHPRAHWMTRLAEHDIPHGPLNGLTELFQDPQVSAMGLLTTVADPSGAEVRMPHHTTAFSRSGAPEYRAAPALGAASCEDRAVP